MNVKDSHSVKLIAATTLFSLLVLSLGLLTLVFVPSETEGPELIVTADTYDEALPSDEEAAPELLAEETAPVFEMKAADPEDPGLVLYREPQTRSMVETYYRLVVNDDEVAKAILSASEKYDIPLPLAFSLAYVESEFNSTAMHKNINGSIDRGLFQLNSSSFPKLDEADFYNPEKSAAYGLSHLRYCLDTAGNEIAALAMYNAGANKVRRNNTPQTTLNYISKIESYKQGLEDSFAKEALAMYTPESQKRLLAKAN